MVNALTVDLEDYYHVSGFERYVSRDDWNSYPSRVAYNTQRVLDLLEEKGKQATFFVLGWVAEKYPKVVRQVADAGHEIACHSHWHRLVYSMSPDEFRKDTKRAKAAIEDASGVEAVGYRAPSYSITPTCPWALDVLVELGFRYDSSIFPVEHDRYGWPGQSRFARPIRQAGTTVLWEFPPSTYSFLHNAVPVAGGGYMRVLPYHCTKWAIEHINAEEGQAACVYFHPWEMDYQQPHITASRGSRWRHLIGISRMEKKLRRLLDDFEFAPMGRVLHLSRENEKQPRQLEGINKPEIAGCLQT